MAKKLSFGCAASTGGSPKSSASPPPGGSRQFPRGFGPAAPSSFLKKASAKTFLPAFFEKKAWPRNFHSASPPSSFLKKASAKTSIRLRRLYGWSLRGFWPAVPPGRFRVVPAGVRRVLPPGRFRAFPGSCCGAVLPRLMLPAPLQPEARPSPRTAAPFPAGGRVSREAAAGGPASRGTKKFAKRRGFKTPSPGLMRRYYFPTQEYTDAAEDKFDIPDTAWQSAKAG